MNLKPGAYKARILAKEQKIVVNGQTFDYENTLDKDSDATVFIGFEGTYRIFISK